MLSSINPVIATVRINIQAVTACNRDRFFRIILRKLPSPLPPLSKGGGLTAWHKPLLYSVLLAIPPPFLFTELFCRQDGGIALRQQNYFNRRNLQWLSATGGTWSGTLPQKKQSQHITVTAYLLIIALFIPDRSLTSITHQPLKRSEFEATHSRPLSRCRLLQRKYQRIADPMRKHRHNAPLYCPYIRLQGSYLPSFHRLYLRQ